MNAQCEMDFDAKAEAAIAGNVPHLEAAMLQHRRLTRAQLADLLGWSERLVRRVAEESQIILRSPGQHGYLLLEDAAPDQIYAAVNRIRSQMQKMERTLAHYTQVAGLKVALAEKTGAVAAGDAEVAQGLATYFQEEA